MYSGYRNEHTLEMELPKRYSVVFDLLDDLFERDTKEHDHETTSDSSPSPVGGLSESDPAELLRDYCVVIPRDSIVTLNIFNDHLYEEQKSQLP